MELFPCFQCVYITFQRFLASTFSKYRRINTICSLDFWSSCIIVASSSSFTFIQADLCGSWKRFQSIQILQELSHPFHLKRNSLPFFFQFFLDFKYYFFNLFLNSSKCLSINIFNNIIFSDLIPKIILEQNFFKAIWFLSFFEYISILWQSSMRSYFEIRFLYTKLRYVFNMYSMCIPFCIFFLKFINIYILCCNWHLFADLIF